MGAPVVLLALALFPVAAAASLELHYMVIFPAVIPHSQEEKLCIHLSSLTEAVHMAITLEVTTQNHTLVEQDVEKPGIFLVHHLPVKFRIVNLDADLNVIKREYSRIWLQISVKEITEVRCHVLKKIEINIEHPPFITTVDEEFQLTVANENGEVHFSLDTTSWNSTLVSLKKHLSSAISSGKREIGNSSARWSSKATYNLGKDNEQDSSESYTGVEDSFHWLKPFYSESNSFLEIKARNDVMPCDQEQEVQVDYILDQNKLSSEADHINFYYLEKA
ncbi:hypothetical protein AV530_012336 [Patagioenas fasciata monilis]|uniref:Uncharacterized protein n=1 Tax=Patagioenas fasciata monilis TaxID=372326 RepID=A0A1V4JAN0_PATFA|nr:hypothetical protein AV530_012336 [Patagioenas fasciata monilis]